MDSIFREPKAEEIDLDQSTSKESDDGAFIPLNSRRHETPTDKLHRLISGKEQEAVKKGLPFARHAAWDEVHDIAEEKRKLMNRQGHLRGYTEKKVNWVKFSDLKNFEVVKEDEVPDEHLSKQHRLPIFFKTVTYQYEGYSNKYIVQESRESAVQRAAGQFDVGNTVVEKAAKEAKTPKVPKTQ